MGKAGVTGHQFLPGLPWSLQNQEIQRWVLITHMANPDGYLIIPAPWGSLGSLDSTCPPGQWRGWWQWPGKGNVGYMTMQTPGLKIQVMEWPTLDKASSEQQEMKTWFYLWTWKRWLDTGAIQAWEGWIKRNYAQVPLRKCLLGFCGSYSWEMQTY